MRVFRTIKDNTNFLILLIKHKHDDKYSFVNLTKEHICECNFNSEEDAINDLIKYKHDHRIDNFYEVDIRIFKNMLSL